MAVRRRSSKRSARRATRRRVSRRKVVRQAKKAKKPKKTPLVGKKWQVWNGTRERTIGGLTKKDLMKSKSGKIVSKKQALRAKGNMKKNGLGKWMAAVKQVRKEMGLKGFVAIKKGTTYYKRVRAVYEA